MGIKSKIRGILSELKNHTPFTLAGAVTGILLMILFRDISHEAKERLFMLFHPGHVLLSAMVTASLFQLHRKAKQFIMILIIGYVGSIGIATLSDCVIPFFGESILGVSIPAHADLHEHESGTEDHETYENESDHDQVAGHESDGIIEHDQPAEHNGPIVQHQEEIGHSENDHKPHLHLGFIEEWYLVNPAAILGVILAYLIPSSRYPHALHVLVSTWASSSHMLMNTHAEMSPTIFIGMFVVLFIAVWFPCCLSDIIFPMLFVDASVKHDHCMFCKKKDNQEKEDN